MPSCSVPRCQICGTDQGLQRCGRCRAAYYCGVAHQREDWEVHQQTCYYNPPVANTYVAPVPQAGASAFDPQVYNAVSGFGIGTGLGSVFDHSQVDPNVGTDFEQPVEAPVVAQELVGEAPPPALPNSFDAAPQIHESLIHDPLDADLPLAPPTAGVLGSDTLANDPLANDPLGTGLQQPPPSAHPEPQIDEKPQPKPNQATLDGNSIFMDPASSPGEFSERHLPRQGSNKTIPHVPAIPNDAETKKRKRKQETRSPLAASLKKKTRALRPPEATRAPKSTKDTVQQEPKLSIRNEDVEEPKAKDPNDVSVSKWKTNLGVLVLHGERGFYGDGLDFKWQEAVKWVENVQYKKGVVIPKKKKGRGRTSTKAVKQEEFVDITGRWHWCCRTFGPNNEGRFKLRVSGEGIKGTWGWKSRNRGGGSWSGTKMALSHEDMPEEEEEEEEPSEAAEAESVAPPPNDESSVIENFEPAIIDMNDADQDQQNLDVSLCHAAVGGLHEDIPRILEKGANPNNKVVENCTPVIHGVIMDYPKVIKALVDYPGAYVDLNTVDQSGNTPLHKCVEHGHVACAKVLLGAACTTTRAKSWIAVLHPNHPLFGKMEVLKLIALYAAPVDLSIKNSIGMTVMDFLFNHADRPDYDSSANRKEIIRLIRESGLTIPGDSISA